MRRCHSESMQDYRREHNAEMWDRPSQHPVVVPSRKPKRCPIAKAAVKEQGIGE